MDNERKLGRQGGVQSADKDRTFELDIDNSVDIDHPCKACL